MKHMQKIVAALTAAVMVAAAVPASAVFAEDAVIVIPRSEYIPLERDVTGTLNMTIQGGRAIRVRIENQTKSEGTILYYDTTLETDGTYAFPLSSCEYNMETDAYDSSFTVTVWDKTDRGVRYTQENLIVVDPGFTQTASESRYDWNIVSAEGETQKVTPTVTEASLQEKVWQGSTALQMQYMNYTPGDVNGDGSINAADVSSVLTYAARESLGMEVSLTAEDAPLSEEAAFQAADLNEDGVINSQDATFILTYAARDGAGLDPDWDTIVS